MDMKTMISHCIDEHNLSYAIEYALNNKSHLRLKELADVIDIWGEAPSKSFRYKDDKYSEVIRILHELEKNIVITIILTA